MYIAIRTDDGRNIGKISFYCNTLQVSRQAFYDYLERKGKPWKYQPLANAMRKIHDEDEENADYGRVRMYQALKYGKEVGKLYVSAIFDCYDLMPNGLPWQTIRICSAIGGIPPAVKRRRFFSALTIAA